MREIHCVNSVSWADDVEQHSMKLFAVKLGNNLVKLSLKQIGLEDVGLLFLIGKLPATLRLLDISDNHLQSGDAVEEVLADYAECRRSSVTTAKKQVQNDAGDVMENEDEERIEGLELGSGAGFAVGG